MERFIFCAVHTGSVSNTPNIHQSHGALFQGTFLRNAYSLHHYEKLEVGGFKHKY